MINLKLLKQSWLNYRYDKTKIVLFLTNLGNSLRINSDLIIKANQKDLAILDISDYKYPRLAFDQIKIDNIIKSLKELKKQKIEICKEYENKTLPNGLTVSKIKSAIGLIAVIFESRPNVTIDVACLCLLSGNSVILKGGKEAWNTNQLLVELIHESMRDCNLDTSLVTLLGSDKTEISKILKAKGIVDLIIPRGSKNLIDFVTSKSRVPVIETGASPVHLYVDEVVDTLQTIDVIINAKTQNTSACNSLDTLLIKESELAKLNGLETALESKGIKIHCIAKDLARLNNLGYKYLEIGKNSIFEREYLSLNLNIRIVKDIDQAILHIHKYSLGHSETIISKNEDNIDKFLNSVDSGCIFVNTPSSFADGGEFGLGAEIGISTQKLHARGPMGTDALTTYKWKITSNYSIRK
jgi:glutamate-5-semialdehyde dehydrogenase